MQSNLVHLTPSASTAQAISYAFNRNVTTEALYPYASGATGKTGACDVPLLRSTKPGQVVQTGQDANYVYPWGDANAMMLVSNGETLRNPE